MTHRRYSEEEMALILKRAVENQGKSNLPARSPSQGFSLEDMQEIGAEVGIDAAQIAAAAKSLEYRPEPVGDRSGLLKFRSDRWIDVDVEESDLQDMVALVRRNVKKPGEATEVLGGVEWKGKTTAGPQHVSIRPEQGGTRVEVAGAYTEPLVGGLLGTAPMGAVFAGAMTARAGASPALVAIFALVGFVLALLPWWALIRNSQDNLQRVADQLEAYLSQKQVREQTASRLLEDGES